jgi:hypothetical protein
VNNLFPKLLIYKILHLKRYHFECTYLFSVLNKEAYLLSWIRYCLYSSWKPFLSTFTFVVQICPIIYIKSAFFFCFKSKDIRSYISEQQGNYLLGIFGAALVICQLLEATFSVGKNCFPLIPLWLQVDTQIRCSCIHDEMNYQQTNDSSRLKPSTSLNWKQKEYITIIIFMKNTTEKSAFKRNMAETNWQSTRSGNLVMVKWGCPCWDI